jgi:membrane fusion protein (multidrug efflux system)
MPSTNISYINPKSTLMKTRIPLLSAFGAALLLLSACGGKTEQAGGAAAGGPAPIASRHLTRRAKHRDPPEGGWLC